MKSRSHLLQLFFNDECINQFFHYVFIVIGKLLNGFELLKQFSVFKGGFNLFVVIAAYQLVNSSIKNMGQLFKVLAGGCTPLSFPIEAQ